MFHRNLINSQALGWQIYIFQNATLLDLLHIVLIIIMYQAMAFEGHWPILRYPYELNGEIFFP